MGEDEKKVSRRKYLKYAGAIVVVGAVAGAGYEAYQYSKPAPSTEAILFGMDLCLTGGATDLSLYALDAAQLWEEKINKEGGILVSEYGRKIPVKIIYYDNKGEPAISVKNMERLCTADHVHALVATPHSAHGMPSSVVSEKYKIPSIANIGGMDDLFTRGFEYYFGLFNWSDNLLPVVKVLDLLPSADRPKTFSMLVQDSTYWNTASGVTRPMLETDYNLENLSYETFAPNTSDFTASVMKLKQLNPDAFLFQCSGSKETFFMAQQMKDANWKPKYGFLGDAPSSNDWVPTFEEWGDGFVVIGTYDEFLPWPGVKEFFADWEAKYGSRSTRTKPCNLVWDSFTYASFELFKVAIEKSGSINNEKIREGLLSLKDYMTMIGPVTFGDKYSVVPEKLHNVKLQPSGYLVQIQNGEREAVWPEEIATADFVYPMPS